jgi:hypothetical protein
MASDKDLLKNYQRINNNFSFEFVNPDQQPGLVKEFKVKSQGDVFVQYGAKKQLAQTLLNSNQPEPLSEIKLTNTIEKIQRDRLLNVFYRRFVPNLYGDCSRFWYVYSSKLRNWHELAINLYFNIMKMQLLIKIALLLQKRICKKEILKKKAFLKKLTNIKLISIVFCYIFKQLIIHLVFFFQASLKKQE